MAILCRQRWSLYQWICMKPKAGNFFLFKTRLEFCDILAYFFLKTNQLKFFKILFETSIDKRIYSCHPSVAPISLFARWCYFLNFFVFRLFICGCLHINKSGKNYVNGNFQHSRNKISFTSRITKCTPRYINKSHTAWVVRVKVIRSRTLIFVDI